MVKERLKMLSNTFFFAVFASLVLGASAIPFNFKVLSQDTANKGSLIEGGHTFFINSRFY